MKQDEATDDGTSNGSKLYASTVLSLEINPFETPQFGQIIQEPIFAFFILYSFRPHQHRRHHL